MLGRPNCIVPVFMSNWPGAWLNASVTIDFTIAMSSTISPVNGNNSPSSVPLRP
jgi:hypothetical protein